MTEELLKEASNKNAVMIDNPKFWSFHKHKTASIRGAWFETLAALLQYAPYFIEQHYQQATTSSFQSLDETEPVALPYVWAAILLVTEKCSNWYLLKSISLLAPLLIFFDKQQLFIHLFLGKSM